MVAENPTWRAPRIYGELAMLGFDVSERSVSRWMQRAPRTPESGQRWLIFLRNHREAIAAMDFFSVPTVTFNLLYVFFIIGHDRRRILHFNVTRHPLATARTHSISIAENWRRWGGWLLIDHPIVLENARDSSLYASRRPAFTRRRLSNLRGLRSVHCSGSVIRAIWRQSRGAPHWK